MDVQEETRKNEMKGGIDVLTGKAMLPSIEGIWDNYRVKRQFIQLSTVIASQLMLVDEVMSAGRNMGGNANMPYPAIQTSGGPVAPPVTLTNLLSGYNNASTSDIHTNALGTLGSIALNVGKNIGGKIIGSFLGNNDKEEKEPTDSITKAASSFNFTSDELNEASEAISAKSNDTLKPGKSDNKEHKKGEVWYDTDANGNSIAKTIGPDGTPMVVKNKDNEEVQHQG